MTGEPLDDPATWKALQLLMGVIGVLAAPAMAILMARAIFANYIKQRTMARKRVRGFEVTQPTEKNA